MKEVSVILLYATKFAATFPYAIYGLDFTFWDTIIYANLGGVLGLLGTMYLSKFIIYSWETYVRPLYRKEPREKKVFSKRNRRIVALLTKYGFTGLVILTPVLFSIPIGGFLMTKYYGIRLKNIGWMAMGLLAWSFIYTLACFSLRSMLMPYFT